MTFLHGKEWYAVSFQHSSLLNWLFFSVLTVQFPNSLWFPLFCFPTWANLSSERGWFKGRAASISWRGGGWSNKQRYLKYGRSGATSPALLCLAPILDNVDGGGQLSHLFPCVLPLIECFALILFLSSSPLFPHLEEASRDSFSSCGRDLLSLSNTVDRLLYSNGPSELIVHLDSSQCCPILFRYQWLCHNGFFPSLARVM